MHLRFSAKIYSEPEGVVLTYKYRERTFRIIVISKHAGVYRADVYTSRCGLAIYPWG
jgi:hypothetical protein